MTVHTTLRALQAADLAAVLAIEAQSHSHPWAEASFLSSFAAGHWMQGVFSTSAQGGALLAYAVCAQGIDDWELLNLTTAPTQRRQGRAMQLMVAGEAAAAMAGAQRMLLEVRAGNTAAIAAYRFRGFERIAMRKAYYAAGAQGGREDALIYALALPAQALPTQPIEEPRVLR